VFFSSHVLSDAEALCSRVAMLANGRLVAAGHVSDLTAFRQRGWELGMSDLPEDLVARLGARIIRAVPLGERRYILELPVDPAPETLVAELTATGARLVSLNPIRDTLEDVFVRQVAGNAAAGAWGWGPTREKK